MDTPRRNISQACAACRSRKCRCDGAAPKCSRCQLKNLECDYTQVKDKRQHNAARRKIEDLELKVRMLQEELRAARAQGISQISNANIVSNIRTTTDGQAHNSELPVYRAVDSLQLDWHTGNLVFMNPTSIPRLQVNPTETSVSQWLPLLQLLGHSDEIPSQNNVSLEETEELLNLYFTFLNGFNTFVDEHSFRRDLILYSENPNQSHPAYSPCLHMAMLALASHITAQADPVRSSDVTNAGTRGFTFLQRALSCLEVEIENPKPATVTAIVILSSCLADLGKSSLSWVYDGIAARLTSALGCQVDSQSMVDQGLITQETYNLRANAFWTAYIEDKLAALYNGRMPSLGEEDYNLSLPKPSSAAQCGVPELTDLQAALISLGDICAEIIRSLYGFASRSPTNECSIARIQDKLHNWSSNLPFATRLPWNGGPRQASPQVLAIHATFNTLSIIFHKSFLRRHCLDSAEGRICFEAALSTVKLAKTFDLTYTILKAPITMSQNLYIPGTVLTLIIADLFDQNDKWIEREQSQKALDDIMTLLFRLSSSWRCSLQAYQALKTMGENYVINRSTNPQPSGDFAGLELGQDFDIDSVLNFDWTTFDHMGGIANPNSG